MNSQQAREFLILYRSGDEQDGDPELAQALALAREDQQLAQWFRAHCALQEQLRAQFRNIQVPEGLKEQILSERKVQTSRSIARSSVLVMAVIVFAVLLAFFAVKNNPREDLSFSTFRHRMAGTVLRAYPKMDLYTNDLAQIRNYLAEHQGIGDYVLPDGLKKLSGTGCKVMQWHGRKVSMVCFNSGTNGKPTFPDLFLFIIDRTSVVQAPANHSPEWSKISKMVTASWTDNDKTYVLGGLKDVDFLKQYLGE